MTVITVPYYTQHWLLSGWCRVIVALLLCPFFADKTVRVCALCTGRLLCWALHTYACHQGLMCA